MAIHLENLRNMDVWNGNMPRRVGAKEQLRWHAQDYYRENNVALV